MIRQYHGQRRQGGDNPLGVGVVASGTIVYLQDDLWWRDRYRGRPLCRNPWIVTAFLNGMVAAARRNRNTGLWEDVYVAGRSDMAVIRSLRDGRERQVAVRILILHDDEGLVRQPSLYPTLPDFRSRVGQTNDAEPRPERHQSCRTQPTRTPHRQGTRRRGQPFARNSAVIARERTE